MRFVGLLGTFAVVVACSGSSDSSVVSADTACTNFADAICQALNDCVPLLLQLEYGDVATCSTRQKSNCVPTINAPGSALTTAQVASCASALPNAACDDLLGRNLPDACHAQAGSLADGAACSDDSQCANKKCKKHKDAACGVCSSPAAAGGPCEVDENCDYGLACATNGVCVAQGMGGAICDVNHPCRSSFVCHTGSCVQPGAEGAPCDPMDPVCSLAKADYCDPTTKVCKKVATAPAGQSCGLPNGTLTICTASGTCKPPNSVMGTCLAAAPDGMPCDATSGPACTPPAKCDSGQCKIPDPSACK
ncbi:MAG TPA: hypothetical protein VIF62_38610 [Labilithrix sp.]